MSDLDATENIKFDSPIEKGHRVTATTTCSGCKETVEIKKGSMDHICLADIVYQPQRCWKCAKPPSGSRRCRCQELSPPTRDGSTKVPMWFDTGDRKYFMGEKE
jgi:hypothetical protein